MSSRYKKVKNVLEELDSKKQVPIKPLPKLKKKINKPDYDPKTLKPFKEPKKPVDPATLALTYEKKVSKTLEAKSDIGNIWKEQEKIRRMDKRLEEAYKLAQKRAKLLKKELKKRARTGDALNPKGILGPDLHETLVEKKNRLSRRSSRLSKKAAKQSIKAKVLLSRVYSAKHGRKLVYGSSTLLLAGITALGISQLTSDSTQQENDAAVTSVQGDTTEKNTFTPTFSLLLPIGKSIESIGGVRLVSPPDSPPTYAFIDSLSDQQIQVSQQELPASFKDDIATKVEAIARDFQATNIIQVDQTAVYHGLQEKSGVQSLVFSKNDRLVFIVSPTKLSDEQWASYVLSLQ